MNRMINVDYHIELTNLPKKLVLLWELSAEKIMHFIKKLNPSAGSPVFIVEGKYTKCGWTGWARGGQPGFALLQYDETGEGYFLQTRRKADFDKVATHINPTGVHDHEFNSLNVKTRIKDWYARQLPVVLESSIIGRKSQITIQ